MQWWWRLHYPAVLKIVLLGNVATREYPRVDSMNSFTLICFCCLFFLNERRWKEVWHTLKWWDAWKSSDKKKHNKMSGGKLGITFLIKGIYLILKKMLQAFKVSTACTTQRDHRVQVLNALNKGSRRLEEGSYGSAGKYGSGMLWTGFALCWTSATQRAQCELPTFTGMSMRPSLNTSLLLTFTHFLTALYE